MAGAKSYSCSEELDSLEFELDSELMLLLAKLRIFGMMLFDSSLEALLDSEEKRALWFNSCGKMNAFRWMLRSTYFQTRIT